MQNAGETAHMVEDVSISGDPECTFDEVSDEINVRSIYDFDSEMHVSDGFDEIRSAARQAIQRPGARAVTFSDMQAASCMHPIPIFEAQVGNKQPWMDSIDSRRVACWGCSSEWTTLER